MKNATASIDASSPSRPARQPAPATSSSLRPVAAATADRPLLHWDDLGHGRWTCHEPGTVAVLSPLPAGQAVRLLEVDGAFHLLTGRVADDRAMLVAAEDVLAGF